MTNQAESRVVAARNAHDSRPFPARLRDQEPDVVLCDAGLAGCVSYWRASHHLDPERRTLVDWVSSTMTTLENRLTDRDERAFVQGLRNLALALGDASGQVDDDPTDT